MTQMLRAKTKQYRNGPEIGRDIGVFWNWVQKGESCWIWCGPQTHDGYGRMTTSLLGRIRVHRFSLFLHTGLIPPDMQACHRCDNPLCVRPEHLFWGTPLDNVQDCIAKGRANHKAKGLIGSSNHKAKLNPEKVLQIVELHRSGRGLSELGRIYGITPQSVFGIVKGKNWSHVTGISSSELKRDGKIRGTGTMRDGAEVLTVARAMRQLDLLKVA